MTRAALLAAMTDANRAAGMGYFTPLPATLEADIVHSETVTQNTHSLSPLSLSL